MRTAVKVLEDRCDHTPLDDPEVVAVLDRPGYHRVAWKCPRCRSRWIARGSHDSKQARPAFWFFGWRDQ